MCFQKLSLTWTFQNNIYVYIFHFTSQLLSIVVGKIIINRIHERCLGIIYNDRESTFYELLEKDGSVAIHKRNFRFLACEMFKLKRDMAPELIKDSILPNRQRRYELRNNSEGSSQRPWNFRLVRSKNLGITASWDKRNRDFLTTQS